MQPLGAIMGVILMFSYVGLVAVVVFLALRALMRISDSVERISRTLEERLPRSPLT